MGKISSDERGNLLSLDLAGRLGAKCSAGAARNARPARREMLRLFNRGSLLPAAGPESCLTLPR
jgi:hypothetical protein